MKTVLPGTREASHAEPDCRVEQVLAEFNERARGEPRPLDKVRKDLIHERLDEANLRIPAGLSQQIDLCHPLRQEADARFTAAPRPGGLDADLAPFGIPVSTATP